MPFAKTQILHTVWRWWTFECVGLDGEEDLTLPEHICLRPDSLERKFDLW